MENYDENDYEYQQDLVDKDIREFWNEQEC